MIYDMLIGAIIISSSLLGLCIAYGCIVIYCCKNKI
jgi:hypothetical protein